MVSHLRIETIYSNAIESYYIYPKNKDFVVESDKKLNDLLEGKYRTRITRLNKSGSVDSSVYYTLRMDDLIYRDPYKTIIVRISDHPMNLDSDAYVNKTVRVTFSVSPVELSIEQLEEHLDKLIQSKNDFMSVTIKRTQIGTTKTKQKRSTENLYRYDVDIKVREFNVRGNSTVGPMSAVKKAFDLNRKSFDKISDNNYTTLKNNVIALLEEKARAMTTNENISEIDSMLTIVKDGYPEMTPKTLLSRIYRLVSGVNDRKTIVSA